MKKILISLAVLFILSFLLKGLNGDLFIYQQELKQDMGGPFESSNSNARYALTKAIVDNHTFFLDPVLAEFSSPDVSKLNNRYLSIFTPGVSFLAVPFYLLGKTFNLPQLFTYLLNIFIALANYWLIYQIVRKMGFSQWLGLLTGSIFIFGTNAFTYAGTLTQHHAVTAGLLSLFLICLYPITIKRNLLFGFIWGAGLLMDIPFAVMALPVLFFMFASHLSINKSSIIKKFDFRILFAGFGLIVPILLFALYNYSTTGSYTTIAQSLGKNKDFRGSTIDVSIQNSETFADPTSKKNIFAIYNTRQMIEGVSIMLFSNERGIIYYSPVLVISILGLISYLGDSKSHKYILHPALGILLFGITSYTMFGNPWGGWSFGPRYLISATAMLVLFTPYVLHKYRKSVLFNIMFIVLLIGSFSINSLASLTTNLIPPKQEAEYLAKKTPYTYLHNWQLLNQGNTHSLLYYLLFSNNFSPRNFYFIYTGLITILVSSFYFLYRYEKSSQ